MQAKLLSYTEIRLARLFRRAALQHIRRELVDTSATLADVLFLLEGEGGPAWSPARTFAREWSAAVELERRGGALATAPAAWIHLSQELAALLENRGDWIRYLDSRWRIETGRLGWSRRLLYGALGASSFGIAGLSAAMIARQALGGHWDLIGLSTGKTFREQALTLILIFARTAGTALMAEYGLSWCRKALNGRGEEPRVLFLAGDKGLSLADTPSS